MSRKAPETKALFGQSDAALAQGASWRITARIRNFRRANGRDQFDGRAPTGVAHASATDVIAELVEQAFEFVKVQNPRGHGPWHFDRLLRTNRRRVSQRGENRRGRVGVLETRRGGVAGHIALGTLLMQAQPGSPAHQCAAVAYPQCREA